MSICQELNKIMNGIILFDIPLQYFEQSFLLESAAQGLKPSTSPPQDFSLKTVGRGCETLTLFTTKKINSLNTYKYGLGQTVNFITLFRKDSLEITYPVWDRLAPNYIPYLGQRGQKQIPCPAAHY